MDNELASIDVAIHWPWIRSILDLDRQLRLDRVALALAVAQVNADGQPVVFGSKYWRGADLTPGEAGAARDALGVLHRRRVLTQRKGSGRVGHAWSFRPSIIHWRSMPWRTSARDAELVVGSCVCRGPRAVVAVLPGQRRLLSRATYQIHIPEHMHIRRPGVSPVDDRDYGARPATTARPPGQTPVDDRDYEPEDGAHTVLSEELTFLIGGTEQQNRFARLTKVTNELDPDPTHFVKPGSDPERRLRRAAATLTDPQVDVLIAELRQRPRHFIPRTAELIEDLTTDPAVVRAARDTPSTSALPDEVRALADSFRP